MTDFSTRHASEMYSVIEYPYSNMNNVLCVICHVYLPWSVDRDDPEIGLLIWHYHLVTSHPGVTVQRMSTRQVHGLSPLVKISEYLPRAQHNAIAERHQRQLVREFRSSTPQKPLSIWFSEQGELKSARCGDCDYRIHSASGLDRPSTEMDMNYHIVSKHPKMAMRSLTWQSQLQPDAMTW